MKKSTYNEVTKETAFSNDEFYCVSTSTSGYMSLSWREHFFLAEEDAKAYRDAAKKKGLAVLIVDQDGY